MRGEREARHLKRNEFKKTETGRQRMERREKVNQRQRQMEVRRFGRKQGLSREGEELNADTTINLKLQPQTHTCNTQHANLTSVCIQKHNRKRCTNLQTNVIAPLPLSPTHSLPNATGVFPPLTFCTRRQTTGKHKHGHLPRATLS